ncbi:MAG TPA: FAD-dependent oxidoreductase, partial [Acidimicrobiales bacterium]
MAEARRRAVIVGAGIAGLVAARELRRAGYDVIVLEAANQVAGLATTTVDADGFSFDMGAHFITNRLAAEIGVSDSCRVVRY